MTENILPECRTPVNDVDATFGEPPGLLHPELMYPGMRYQNLLFASVSDIHVRESVQDSAHNLPYQRWDVAYALMQRGVKVRHVTEEIHRARTLDRPDLQQSLRRSAADQVPVTFPSRPRIVHGEKFDHTFASDVLTKWQIQQLADSGATIVTVAPPDAPLSEVRSAEIKRGQAYHGRKGGRPKQSKTARDAKILELRQGGMSIRKIAAVVKVNPKTVYRVIRANCEYLRNCRQKPYCKVREERGSGTECN